MQRPCIVCKSPCWQKRTLGSIAASPPRDTKQGPVGGGGRVRGNSICACMYVWGQC